MEMDTVSSSGRGRGRIVLAAGIVLILCVGAYYFKGKGETIPSTEGEISDQSVDKTSVLDETEDWKTYRNEQAGFELKYPKGWFVYEEADSVFFQPQEETGDNVPGAHADAFSVVIEDTSKTALSDDFIVGVLGDTAFEKELVTIGGEDGYKVKTTCEGVGCGAPQWFVINGGKLYHFDSNLGYSSEFDYILSTFKFVSRTSADIASADETSSWKTYKNDSYGFEFKYPEEFVFTEKEVKTATGKLLGSISTEDKGYLGIEIKEEKLDPDNIRGLYGKIDNVEAFKIGGGIQAYRYKEGDAGCGGYVVDIPKDNITIEVIFSDCLEQESELVKRQDNILSTFRFID